MQPRNQEALDTVTARFFKGLGDPVRLRILEFLERGERSVGEIVEQLGLPQNHVSMHLGCLRWCGYVETRREGRYVYYSLADHRVTEILRLAHQFLRGSEVYLMACEVLGKTGARDEKLANVTGWLNRPKVPDKDSSLLTPARGGPSPPDRRPSDRGFPGTSKSMTGEHASTLGTLTEREHGDRVAMDRTCAGRFRASRGLPARVRALSMCGAALIQGGGLGAVSPNTPWGTGASYPRIIEALVRGGTMTATEATLRIPAIHCSGCSTTVKRALEALPGVSAAAVDHESKQARFSYEESLVSLDQIKESLDDIGFGPDDE